MNSGKKKDSKPKPGMSRKSFLSSTAMAAGGFMFVPRHVLGGKGYMAPSDRLNIACIGVGGMGASNTRSLAQLGENIYALCDVDEEYAAETFHNYPKAKKYTDFREMLDNEDEIDAVMVATPDNTHTAIAIYAMKMGKHAFVQKPLTRTIYEARRMAQVAKETGVATQMGNQGHRFEGTLKIVEWIRQGVIGDVTKVDCWTNRPRGYWPQGAEVKPADVIAVTPHTMHWDLWVGPSPYRPYDPAIAPFAWRGRWDYGSGSLGDMGAHIMDQPYWALELGNAKTVQASSTPFNDEAFPLGSKVHYEFPARGNRPAVELTWYDGGLMPERPKELEDGQPMGSAGGGMIFHGSKGKLMADVYGNNPRLIPVSRTKDAPAPKQTLPRTGEIHEEWVKAAKGNGKTSSNFEYAAALTETMLLGNIAIRFSNKPQRLEWDAKNMRITNLEEANQWLEERKLFRPPYQEIIG